LMSTNKLLLSLALVLSFCLAIAASSTPLSSRELLLLNEKKVLKLPLDRDNLKLALSSGLVTNRPNEEKEIPFVFTPFGVFARECVLGVDGGSKVSNLDNGDLLVKKADGSSWVYQASEYNCNERFEPLNVPNRKPMNKTDIPAPLWQDGWLDNVWDADNSEFGSFTSSYTVPQTPSDGSAILFWFIGLECANSDLAILQPVLVWNNIVPSWSFQSWYCCPSGTPNYATDFILGFGPSQVLTGIIQPVGGYGSDFTVLSCNQSTCSALASPAQGRIFVAADTTLETYRITDCSQFASGTMTFSNMVIQDISGSVLTPAWYGNTGATECSGQITVVDANTITITHQG